MNCTYCGLPVRETQDGDPSLPPLEYDHFIPRSGGGPTIPENLLPACRPCNQIKSAQAFDSVEAARAAIHAGYWGWMREATPAEIARRKTIFGGRPPGHFVRAHNRPAPDGSFGPVGDEPPSWRDEWIEPPCCNVPHETAPPFVETA